MPRTSIVSLLVVALFLAPPLGLPVELQFSFFWFLDPLGDRPHPEPRCATMAELKCGKIGPSGVKR